MPASPPCSSRQGTKKNKNGRYTKHPLTDGNTRPVREHPRGDVHGLQLLEEELRGVRDVHLRDLRLVLAGPALERLLGQIPAWTSVYFL